VGLQFGVSYRGGDYEYVRVRRWPFSIGRNPANDLCLPNSSHISRRHARVFKEADGYRLVTQGTNPTFLNGEILVPDQPVPIQPGDRIELPDYLLDVRDTRENGTPDATVNVELIGESLIIIRRIASEIGASSWTAPAIHTWLTGSRPGAGPREIWLRHQQVALCLPGRISLTQLEHRLVLFDDLIAHLDPHALEIDLVDPGSAIIPD
jgi:pSer/pThr/pTyr-binding forkhead associated (FHA) protein